MADPVSLTAISIGASAAGAGVNAFGSYQAGKSSRNMYNYQAAVADMNKKVADQNAAYETSVGEAQAAQKGLETQSKMGQARAAGGASGLDVNTGSKLAVQDSIQTVGEYDQAVIRANSARKAYGYEVEAAQDTAQGQIYRMAGEDSYKAGEIKAASSILGGASSVSSKWLDAQRSGIFS